MPALDWEDCGLSGRAGRAGGCGLSVGFAELVVTWLRVACELTGGGGGPAALVGVAVAGGGGGGPLLAWLLTGGGF